MSHPVYTPITAEFYGMIGHLGFAVFDVQQRLIRDRFYRPVGWKVTFHGALHDGKKIVSTGDDEYVVIKDVLNQIHAYQGSILPTPAGGP
jgi:hypothetical protein